MDREQQSTSNQAVAQAVDVESPGGQKAAGWAGEVATPRPIARVIERSTDRRAWEPCPVYIGSPIAGIAVSLRPGRIWSDGWGNHYRAMA